jgi:hypothetical protein
MINRNVLVRDQYYPVEQTFVCSHCKARFVDRKDAEGPKTFHIGNSHFCSYACRYNAGYRLNEYGDLAKINEPYYFWKTLLETRDNVPVEFASESNPYRIGFEVEKEDKSLYKALNSKQGLKLPDGWVPMYERSLKTGYGMEFVSPAYNLANKARIKKDLQEYQNIFDSNYSKECGGHISISKLGFSGRDLAISQSPMIAFFLCLFPARMRNINIKKYTFLECQAIAAKHKSIHYSGSRLELRMISAVKSSKQLWRRYLTIEWFLLNSPTKNEVVDHMRHSSGFLRKTYRKIYGIERWADICNRYNIIYDWFWNGGDNQELVNNYIERDEYE